MCYSIAVLHVLLLCGSGSHNLDKLSNFVLADLLYLHTMSKPVIPLPDKVPLTTGEENETVLYSHRAKLFRFAESMKMEGEETAKKEWKERGVGDIKILKHSETNKIRLLMRREPILEVCLNHCLTPEITMTQKDDKSWTWYAPDFTDGEIKREHFCIRFKTPDIAKEFKTAVDAVKGIGFAKQAEM